MIKTLGININSIVKEEALRKINEFLYDGNQHWIATINPEIILKARKDTRYREILNSADLRVADGIGIVWVSGIFGEKLKERIAGVDLIYDILTNLKRGSGFKFMIIGADEDSRRKAAGNLKNFFPGIDLGVSALNIDFNGADKEIFLKLNSEIKDFRPNILFVAFGAPYQEKWIYENLKVLPTVKLAIGVGGAIDMISEKFPRAPYFMRKIGFEWLWRLMLEPRRIRRVFNAIIVFPLLVIIRRKNFNL